VNRDCAWTAFNFFNETPDNRYNDLAYLQQRLAEDFFLLTEEPRYGDLVLFSKPNGDLFHACIYLADDIVYTKNGDTAVHPWMLSTLKDLVQHYSYSVDPDQKVTVHYYRSKLY
jgi:hypothetical protein